MEDTLGSADIAGRARVRALTPQSVPAAPSTPVGAPEASTLNAVPRAALQQLMHLRAVAVTGQCAAIVTSATLGVALPLVPMAAIVGVLIALNVLTYMRLRAPREPTQADIVANLTLDLVALTALLFLSGGTSNPFSVLYVLHAVLLALLLPRVVAASGTAIVIACYSVLSQAHYPLELTNGQALPPGLSQLGLAVSFAVTAGFSAWFVARITAALRDHERRLAEAVHRALRDDAVLRVGALAAGAAHELASPLATIAALAGEIERSAASPAVVGDARRLRGQLEVCRERVANLMAAAGHAQSSGGGPARLDAFLEGIANTCRTTRRTATITCEWAGLAEAPIVIGDHGLRQALLVLLNNAVDASPDAVRFTASAASGMLRVRVVDEGDGLPPQSIAKLGNTFFTTKPPGKGAGLGLVVASRAIERLGGTLRWTSVPGAGTTAEVALPLQGLSLGQGHR
jgi:two-component system, sensor histidine kinase RegB